MKHYLEQMAHLKALIFDVDGVFTNAKLHLGTDGIFTRSFNTKDLYALHQAKQAGLYLGCITRGTETQLKTTLKELGVEDVFLGISFKIEPYEDILAMYDFKDEEVLYMGDDVPDMEVMLRAGVSACPADAVHEVTAIAKYISPLNGGEGCIRDVIEKVLRVQEKWPTQKA
jgi:3-deoxy-D-manno-octulosonate 8-phosphate phosphatase (KDO 8-P phosphatase)